MKGEVDILGWDLDQEIIACCEVKSDDSHRNFMEAYEQLWTDKNHFSSLNTEMEIRTCVKLGDEPAQEVIPKSRSDLREELAEKLDEDKKYEIVCENLDYYMIEDGKERGRQKGTVPVFAKNSEEKEIGLCSVVVGAKNNVCQSVISRLEKAKKYFSKIENYEDYAIETYIMGNGTSVIEVEIEEIETDKGRENLFRADYGAIDKIIEETPEKHHFLSSLNQDKAGQSDSSRSKYGSLPSPHSP